ncbi:MAG: hypothetical protein WAM62_06185 [Pseudolabrys sp.]
MPTIVYDFHNFTTEQGLRGRPVFVAKTVTVPARSWHSAGK